mmetsp:Transcript_13450/g.27450  ORF Transcript_13450/g.27450 Transcript_13450/m.27450 type:complete len:105 (-) Transcript_13450:389-703(-)
MMDVDVGTTSNSTLAVERMREVFAGVNARDAVIFVGAGSELPKFKTNSHSEMKGFRVSAFGFATKSVANDGKGEIFDSDSLTAEVKKEDTAAVVQAPQLNLELS